MVFQRKGKILSFGVEMEIETVDAVSEVTTSKGCFSYTVKGFSGICAERGAFVQSPAFTLCGHDWEIGFYPNGSKQEDYKDHYGLFLYYLGLETVKARVRFSVNSTTSPRVKGYTPTKEFTKGSNNWGYNDMFPLKDIDTYVIDDQMKLTVEIEVFSDIVHNVQLDHEKLGPCLSRVFSVDSPSSMLFHDVTFRFADSTSTFVAHKCILASRSEVFRAMLSSGMQEEIKGEILVVDCEFDVMKALVHFLYADSLTGHEAVSKEYLLAAAVKYAVPALVQLCDAALCSEISSGNAVHLLHLAQNFGAERLRKETLRYIATHCQCVADLLDSSKFPSTPEADNSPPRSFKRKNTRSNAGGTGRKQQKNV